MKKLFILFIGALLYADEFYYEYGKKVYLEKAPTQIQRGHTHLEDATYATRYYVTKNGQKVGVNNEIIIKCKVSSCTDTIKNKYNVKSIEKIADKYYVVVLNNIDKVFSMSRDFYQESDIEISHPNFEIRIEQR